MWKNKLLEIKLHCDNDGYERGINLNGFTLVELSLSLVFIAILSIAVLMVMSGAISSYHRSIVLNKIDSVGGSLVRDMQSVIKRASTNSLKSLCGDNYSKVENGFAKCEEDEGKNFASVARYAKVKIKGEDTSLGDEVPVYGAVCTGNYSYVWNSGYLFNSEYEVTDGNGSVSAAKLYYKEGEKPATNYRLIKVKDEKRKVCVAALRYDKNGVRDIYDVRSSVAEFDKTAISDDFYVVAALGNDVSEDLVWYLGGSDGDASDNLAIYDMTVDVSEQQGLTRNAYYYSSFILGTVQGGVNINASGSTCAAPEGYNRSVENIDYCAVNKFNFAALASGG